jgi:uncharacterized protein
MMDIAMLQLQAAKTGLGIKYLAKEERISLLLQQLHERFGESIVLKGGTALNRGYLQSSDKGRFSEDIDLDYAKHQSLDTKITFIRKEMQTIQEFSVSSPRLLHQTARFDCRYTNQLNEQDRVQVEFYLSERPPSRPPRTMLLQSQYAPSQATLFSVYSLEELLAMKLVTLYRRSEGKDIYDVFYGLDLDFNKSEVMEICADLLAYYHEKKTYEEFVQALLDKVAELQRNAKDIGNSTNHFIPTRLRPNWPIFIATLSEKIHDKL